MYYVQETDKPDLWREIFNIIKLKNNKIILPINQKMDIKKSEKLAIKTKKLMEQTNSNSLVLSRKIKEQEYYVDFLNSYNLKIMNGRQLFNELIIEVLEYIIENRKNQQNEEFQISILINDVDEHILQNIKQIIKTYKRVNIVTNHLEKFKSLEEQELEEDGIVLFISNNKRKSISKSQIILNIDFPTELINKYKIYEKAIIVNFRGNVIIEQKRFDGINIKDYEINFEKEIDEETKKLYYAKELYEATIEFRQPIKYIKERLRKDKVQIKSLQANNITI